MFFKSQCEFWQKILGLHSWKVYYKHTPCGQVLADCSTNYSGRVATIRLNTKWTLQPTEDGLHETAIHEVLEIMLSPLLAQAKSRVWDTEEYEKDHHAIIRVFERLLLNKLKNDKR